MAMEIFGDLGVVGGPVQVSANGAPDVRKIVLRSDHANNRITADIHTSQGRYRVNVPFRCVAVIFDESLAECGVPQSDSMGSAGTLQELYDSFGWSLGSAFKSVKRATVKAVVKTANLAQRAKTLSKKPIDLTKHVVKKLPGGRQLVALHDRAHALADRYAKKAVRSPVVGAGTAALAAVFPPVGGPALAAWTIANRIDAITEASKRAAEAARRGNLSAMGRAALQAGAAQIPQVRQLTNAMPQSAGGLVRGALRNLPAGNSAALAVRYGLGQVSPYAQRAFAPLPYAAQARAVQSIPASVASRYGVPMYSRRTLPFRYY